MFEKRWDRLATLIMLHRAPPGSPHSRQSVEMVATTSWNILGESILCLHCAKGEGAPPRGLWLGNYLSVRDDEWGRMWVRRVKTEMCRCRRCFGGDFLYMIRVTTLLVQWMKEESMKRLVISNADWRKWGDGERKVGPIPCNKQTEFLF